VGKGLFASILVGKVASTTGGGGAAAGVEVCLCSGDFEGALLLPAGSALVLRAGSFLFFSIAVGCCPAAMKCGVVAATRCNKKACKVDVG
jgi:hypothetical protein